MPIVRVARCACGGLLRPRRRWDDVCHWETGLGRRARRAQNKLSLSAVFSAAHAARSPGHHARVCSGLLGCEARCVSFNWTLRVRCTASQRQSWVRRGRGRGPWHAKRALLTPLRHPKAPSDPMPTRPHHDTPRARPIPARVRGVQHRDVPTELRPPFPRLLGMHPRHTSASTAKTPARHRMAS